MFWSPQVCIFLELVSGGSIAVMLRKFGAFSEKMIANFTGQVKGPQPILYRQNVKVDDFVPAKLPS